VSALVLQRCADCDYVANFWRIGCPRCLGQLATFDAQGAGVVMTFSIIHRWVPRFDEHLPIVLVVVELAEGVEVMASLVGDDRANVRVGAPVAVAPEGWSSKPQFQLTMDSTN
jgi:uncharacterized OB-fold protein